MHKLLKKMFAVCCSLVMISVLSSCNGDGQKSTNPDQPFESLKVVSISPAYKARINHQDNPTEFTITFNQDVDHTTFNKDNFLVRDSDNDVEVLLDNFSCSDRSCTAQSKESLKNDTWYNIKITQKVKSKNNVFLTETFNSPFIVHDDVN